MPAALVVIVMPNVLTMVGLVGLIVVTVLNWRERRRLRELADRMQGVLADLEARQLLDSLEE